jgi:hypothetical protein
LVNVLENCGLERQNINAPDIIFGTKDSLEADNPINQVILILNYYLYKCICVGDIPSINDGLKYPKESIEIVIK